LLCAERTVSPESSEPPAASNHSYGRAFLTAGQSEAPGYRAYSYVLLGPSKDAVDPSAAESILSTYLALDDISHVRSAGAEPQDLNIVYFPLLEAPPANPSSTWLLGHFDYARARSILDAAGIQGGHGPTFVSYTDPLPGKSPVDQNELLVVGLSGDPAVLTSALDKQLIPAPAPEAAVRGSHRLTGRGFLLAGKPEDAGYGLYSYVLFGEPVNAANGPLYRAVLDAFLHIPEVRRFEAEKEPRTNLNITYLLLSDRPSTGATVDWLLDHYDFARAQIILAKLMDHPLGPYIVSYKSPLSSASSFENGQLLVEDLSRIPHDLAFLWVNEFTAQAGRAQYWDKPALRTLMLNLRTQVAIDAEAFEEVRTANTNLNSTLASRIKIQE
jgi:hypothetical protein